MTDSLGPGVSRVVSSRERNYAAVVFQANKPPLDSELNLSEFSNFESRANQVRSRMHSGWLMNPVNPMGDYFTNPNYSNLFFFGNQTTGELKNVSWVNVNGWLIPVTGTRTGSPPLNPNNTDTWNRIELNPPSGSTGGNRAEFVFLEVWLQRIDVDPASPGVAAGKPSREFIYRFGNVESGFSHLPDELVDPEINFETTKRVQVQYRIRVIPDVNLVQYPEGFDPTLVLARGALSAPSAFPFENMREELGDPGLWRAGDGNPNNTGTVDGYVYAVPICAVFRRNTAGFSDTGNLAGAFNRNSAATTRDDALIYNQSINLPNDINTTNTQFVLSSISGTILETLTSFGEAYFKIDQEIVRVNSIVQGGPTSFTITVDRGQLGTSIQTHGSGTELIPYTIRPDGLYADQIASTDILDLRHSVSENVDYDSLLKASLISLMKGNLRSTWKRYGSTNSSGPVTLYGDRITDDSIFVGGLTRLDGPNGNRRVWSDSIITERYTVPIDVPSNTSQLNDELQTDVVPYNIVVTWEASAPGAIPGDRLNGTAPWWYNGDTIRIVRSPFFQGLPVNDQDQVQLVDPSEDPDAVIIRFEGMTTDPNGGFPIDGDPPTNPTSPSATVQKSGISGLPILKNGQGFTASLDGATGDILITFDSGVINSLLEEFTDAVPTPATEELATATKMYVSFAVTMGGGRGLSHKPDYIHTAHYSGDPANSARVLTRPGLVDANRMLPTYLNDSPKVQTGQNRSLTKTSDLMVDPGSKTVHVAPYRNILIPNLLSRDGSQLNSYWDGASTQFQGAMPQLDPGGNNTVHSIVDPLGLFYISTLTRYVEVSLEYLPRPGFHYVPIVSISTNRFSSGINWLVQSQEGPFAATNTSDHNRNIVSYPSGAGYYVVTPVVGETYGTGSGNSAFGRKYRNSKIRGQDGKPFDGIQFPPFYGPARITGVYLRDTSGTPPFSTSPSASPFNAERQFVGGAGTNTNLLKDDFDGPTFLLDVDQNGDLTFILNKDVIDFDRAPAGTNWDDNEFFVECTLFAFDRGFLQTNGRLLIARSSGGGSLPIPVDSFTTSTDGTVGIIAPSPLTLNATNNEVTIYYSRQPYQGDVFGSQNSFSDDVYRLGPLTISEQTSLFANKLAPVDDLELPNKNGYEVITSMNFVTSLGTGRLSGSNPIPLLSPSQKPGEVEDFRGTLVDLDRRFSLNRVGFEDWSETRFPVFESSVSSRQPIRRGALSEIFDRDLNPEFAGCTTHLPMGAYFRDKDFSGKILYQVRSSSDIGQMSLGFLNFPPYQAPANSALAGKSTWEGIEFVSGQSSNVNGKGSDSIITVDGTSNVNSVTIFKTARGGAGWSITSPWPGGPISSRMPKARPNAEVGSVLVGTAFLVISKPEEINNIEVHPGSELQMVIVTQASPAYFRETDIEHSANGTNEGFTAIDRFRILGKPLVKESQPIDVQNAFLNDRPLFINDIFDDPVFFGSSDLNTVAPIQVTLTINSDGQIAYSLPERPINESTVQVYLRGVKLVSGIDYTLSGPTFQDLTLIPTIENPAPIVGDTLEVWYIQF